MRKQNKNRLNERPLQKLAADLRRMPEPTPPAQLQARLLADIPTMTPARQGQIRRYRIAGILGVALAAAAAVLIHSFILRDALTSRSTLRRLLNDTSCRHTVRQGIRVPFEETRPWDILPPLPD